MNKGMLIGGGFILAVAVVIVLAMLGKVDWTKKPVPLPDAITDTVKPAA